MTAQPILYSFRRCPYAMRARMGLAIAGVACELREVKLSDKPAALIEASPKATVPVLVLADGRVIDQSLDIMRWALSQADPENWLSGDDTDLIAVNDGAFKGALNRYKYSHREGVDPIEYRDAGLVFLRDLDARLARHGQLCGPTRSLTDIALFPFVRQFAETDRAWFDALPLSALQAWLAGHLGSTLFATIMVRYDPWRPGDTAPTLP